MIRTLRLMVASLVLCMAFTSCTKEYSEENGGNPNSGQNGSSSGTAVFTLAGQPGACTTPIISGIYKQGTAMDATNTAVVSVDVTTVGTYVISTATINGISFSGSGTFVITGLQVVILTATGTPTAAGTFTYIPGFNGCTFPLTVTAGSGGGGVALGNLSCATATTAGTYTQGVLLTAANTMTIPVNVTTAGTYSINTAVINGITFSGSGSLALGNQTIVLTGNGLPVNSGPVLFAIPWGTSSCDVSITFAVGTPPAEGVLDCASAVVAGTYTQGVALDASNTITIDVNVSLAGPYAITTTQINGVSFSGNGTLAAGLQTIVLTGSGTPNSSGTFAMPVALGTSSCSVDINFAAGSTDFLKCSIDGGPIVNFSGLSASLVPGDFTGSGSSGGQSLQISVTDAGGGTIGTGTYHNLSLTNMSLFCVNQLSIGTTIWFDVDATLSSNIFTLNIATITPTTITGTFNGKLTDPTPGGSSKMISNGSFSLTY